MGVQREAQRPAAGNHRVQRGPMARPASGGHGTHTHLLALQRTVGNRAVVEMLAGRADRPAPPADVPVQRTVTILSYDVGARGPDNAVLDVDAVRGAITARLPAGADRTRVLANLAAANLANRTDADVNDLATHLCTGAPTRIAAVADAIGSTLTAQGTNADEAGQFEDARQVATTMSCSKGTPNTIMVGKLAQKFVGGNYAAIIGQIRALDTKLRSRQDRVQDATHDAWVSLLAGDLNVRTAHENGAGWLPAVDVLPHRRLYDAHLASRVGKRNVAAWIRAGNSGERAAFNAINSRKLFAQPDDRRRFLWASYSQSASPYIEFGVPGKKDQRIVFDFTTKTFYFTVHYKWYLGYNPFFTITDA